MRRSNRLAVLAAALIASIGAAGPTLATCTFSQDAAKTTSIHLGGMDLADIPVGSFRVTSEEALLTSDKLRFSLEPKGQIIDIQFNKSNSIISAGLKIRKPITGIVWEAISNGHCWRSIRLDEDTLAGDILLVNSADVRGNVGEKFDISAKSFDVIANHDVATEGGALTGILRLRGTALRITGVSVSIPGAGAVTQNFNAISPIYINIDLESFSSVIVNGALGTDSLSNFDNIDYTIDDLHVVSDQMQVQQIVATFNEGRPTITLSHLAFATPDVTYLGPFGRVQINSVTKFTVGQLTGSAELRSGRLSLNSGGARLFGGDVFSNNILLMNASSETLISGAGHVHISSLTSENFAAEADVDNVSKQLLTTPGFSVLVKKVHLKTFGMRSDPKFTMAGTLSKAQLGSLRLEGDQPLNLLTRYVGQGVVDVQIWTTTSSVTVGNGQISGQLSGLTISGTVSSLAALERANLNIPASGLNANAHFDQLATPLFGGKLSVIAQDFLFRNNEGLDFGPRVRADIALGEADASLSDVELAPEANVSPLRVQTQISYSGPHAKIRMTLDPDAPIPLLVTAHFEVPGFSLQFNPIPFEIGSLEVDVNSLSVSRFTLDLWETTVALSMEGLNIGVGDFRPRKIQPGESKVATNLRGHGITPFSIDRVAGYFELSPWPPAFSELALYNLHFGAAGLVYIGPSDLYATLRQADVSFPHVWMPVNHFPPHADPYVSLNMGGMQATVSWHGTPNGTADIDRFSIELHGQPTKLNGTLALSASAIALSGRAEIPLSTKPDGTHGCTLVVPANVGLTAYNVNGTLEALNGKFYTSIKVTDFNIGRINYFGHVDCRWNQLVIIDVLIPYPCEWSWGIPTKWCTKIEFDIGWVFTVNAIDMHFKPAIIEFQVAGDGKFEACKYSIAELFPVVPPVFAIAPQLPFGGDIARALNDLARTAFEATETILTTGAIQLYSVISLVDFATHGGGLNIRSKCNDIPP